MGALILFKQRGWSFAILLCFFLSSFTSQVIPNLVNNYSFEDTIKCPYIANQVNYSMYWFNPVVFTSPDYFNSCANSKTLTVTTATAITVPNNQFGFQFPRTGNAYCGFAVYWMISPDYRENIKNKLRQKLPSNKKYCVTYYISLAEISRYSTSNVGCYFSNDSMINSSFSPPSLITATAAIEPSTLIGDTINWVKVQGIYIANGTEGFMTFGNFHNDATTNKGSTKPPSFTSADLAYYYIDDISVVEINPANASLKDTLYSKCSLDSKILGTDSTWDAIYSWQSTPAGIAALSCTNCPNPVASPSVTTKYVLTKVQCSSTTKDSVLIIVKSPTITANAGTDSTICLGDKITIGTGDSLSFTSYVWQPGAGLSCTNCASPLANPTGNTTYTLQRTECAFVTSDAVTITIDDCDPTYTVPNIFTPNYDGKNDTWGVIWSNSKYVKDFSVNIYDRWGLQVFGSEPGLSTPNLKWDGHTLSGISCSEGVYFYVISFKKNEEEIKLKGFISLIR